MSNNFYKNDINEIVSSIKDCKKKLHKKKILLVGANGFLGKYFIEVFNIISKETVKFEANINFIVSKNSKFGFDK